MQNNTILGIDIGGSGTKGAIIDVQSGELLTKRIKKETPDSTHPDLIADKVLELIEDFNYEGELVGCGFPAIVKHGTAKSAANVDDAWIGTDIEKLLSAKTGKTVKALNDADAAGIAEMTFGAGKDVEGLVVVLTLGTGIGSSVFVDGKLVPNTEFGHLYLKSQDIVAEKYASNFIRKSEGLDWETWAGRLTEYLTFLERIFSPDMFILCGGVTKKIKNFQPHIQVKTPIKSAGFLNNAGIMGAAMYANISTK